ncbi:MAG: hypothetical protein JOZ22_19625, partial [Acidobacteriia bacterium]|nr:hypothetical protein [Terriglobia bacterium]
MFPNGESVSAGTVKTLKQLDFVFFDAGGGHRAAATALRRMIRAQRRPFAVRMLNLQELLDSIDIFRRLTGIR